MPLPNDPIAWTGAMDPAEQLDFVMDLGGVLEAGEVIDQFSLAMYPEGAALGVAILEDAGRAPELIDGDRAVRLWFAVDPERQVDAAFEANGARIGIELQLLTNSLPARRRERTFVLTLRQR